jgi:putative ABC transport system ATP-binding protein
MRNTTFGFVFQSFNLVVRMNARDNVEMPLVYAGDRTTRRYRAMRALAAVGLERRANHFPSTLSGGEQQRVAIARALVTDPQILLADEPTGNVDTTTSAQLMRLIGELNKDGRTVIIVTHEAAIAAYARRIVKIEDGTVVYDQGQVAQDGHLQLAQMGQDMKGLERVGATLAQSPPIDARARSQGKRRALRGNRAVDDGEEADGAGRE